MRKERKKQTVTANLTLKDKHSCGAGGSYGSHRLPATPTVSTHPHSHTSVQGLLPWHCTVLRFCHLLQLRGESNRLRRLSYRIPPHKKECVKSYNFKYMYWNIQFSSSAKIQSLRENYHCHLREKYSLNEYLIFKL